MSRALYNYKDIHANVAAMESGDLLSWRIPVGVDWKCFSAVVMAQVRRKFPARRYRSFTDANMFYIARLHIRDDQRTDSRQISLPEFGREISDAVA